MITLKEHNRIRGEFWRGAIGKGSSEPRSNNIECPECGKELWDTSPALLLTSSPGQYNVHCPSCGYAGYRIE